MKWLRQAQTPERSLTLRYLILAAMLVPLLALARVHSSLWLHVLLAAGGISLGHWYSYRFLEHKSNILRGFMFIAIHGVLCWMFVGLVGGFTVPQAQFALFTQAITSFDLRYRRSLFNTLIHSLANLYIAATLSRTYELGLYLIAFTALVLIAFFVAERDQGLEQARLHPQAHMRSITLKSSTNSPRRSMIFFSLSFGAIALLGVIIAFLFTPRFANNPMVPPFSLNVPLRGGLAAEIINPGIPLVQVNGWSDEVGDYFFGFDSDLDLRYRGGLSDRVVMYVRSPSRSYWRSHAFDFYDGTSWSQSNKDVITLKRRYGVRFQMSTPLGASVEQARQLEGQEIVQSFTIVHDQPNLIFAAYRPTEVFITAETISVDAGDGLRTPEPLKAGMTYSVISRRPEFNPELLRAASTSYPPVISQRYLQLPSNITQRVINLAHRLTEPHDNPYDKALALNDHLLTEYPYNFFPPPHKPGAEVVDTFLFEDRQGFCEMYVTSFVVMARSLGLPARLVTGYGSGDYNPITNYYEVRFSHAHSWAEVYFPEYGWVPFDPTPGWTPQPYPTPVQNFLFGNSPLTDLNLANLPLGPALAGGLAGLAFFLPFLLGATLLAGLIGLILYLLKRLRLRPASVGFQGYTPLDDHPTRRLILQLFDQAVTLLTRRRQLPRQPAETFSEYTNRVPGPASRTALSQAAEVAAYRPEVPEEGILAKAKAALTALQQMTSK